MATPGTPSRRARIFQYAIVDSSIIDTLSDLMPIFIARLVADRGWIMNGGDAQFGRVGVAVAMRSCTSWRAWRRSVPRLKSSSIWLSCGTDFDRMTSRSGTPWSDCSSGTVTRSSTSVGVSPSAIVWTSILGGANSGKTSTFEFGSVRNPRTSIPAASAATM